jgi:hypothetical protein
MNLRLAMYAGMSAASRHGCDLGIRDVLGIPGSLPFVLNSGASRIPDPRWMQDDYAGLA